MKRITCRHFMELLCGASAPPRPSARGGLHKGTVTQQSGAQRVLKDSVTIPDTSKPNRMSQPAILQLPEHKTAPGWQVRQFGTGPQFTVSEERSGYISLRRR